MFLTPEEGSTIDPVTESDLDRAFGEESFGDFLRLGVSEDDFIESSEPFPASGEYRIRWWSPLREKIHATRKLLSLVEVHQVFVGYLLGRDWGRGLDWVPVEPEKVRIPYEGDSGRFPFTGQLDDGNLFMAFVTGERLLGEQRRWVAVLHLFDSDGNLIHSESRIGGYDGEGSAATRGSIDVAWERADAELARLVTPLIPRIKQFRDVFIRPFEVDLHGSEHGLVYDERSESASFNPRDVVFYFPWDTGNYDT